MATIAPAPGKAMVVIVNSTTLRAASFERTKTAGDLRFPTSGMAPDADGNYQVPHAAGLIDVSYSLRAPFDTGTTFFSATYNIRAGVIVTIRLGMTATLLTPATSFVCLSTRDSNDVERLGEWEATFAPYTDTGAGYFTEAT